MTIIGDSGYLGRYCASRAHAGRLAMLCSALFVCVWLLYLGVAPAVADAAADAVEQDAQAYSRLAIRHDTLLLKLNLKRITPEEDKELDEVGAQGAAIKSRYAPGGPMSRQATAFDKRLKELSVQMVQPAIKGAVADAFPSVEEVRAAYPDPAHSIAALQVLEQMMAEKLGQPLLPTAKAKVDSYHAAMSQLNPKSGSDYTQLLNASDTLRRSPEFQVEVLNRFVPIYAVEAENVLGKERYEARGVADERQIYRAYVVVGLIVLALPLLYLMRGQRAGRSTPWNKDDAYPFQLPPHLRRAEVFRMVCQAQFDCGVVTDKRVLKETVRYTTHTRDVSSAGGITIYGPTTSSTSSSTTVRHKFVLRTPDERMIKSEYMSYDIDAELGHVVSSVDVRGYVLAWHNHSLNTHGAISENIDFVSRLPGRWLWVACVVAAFLGLWSVQRLIVEAGTHADDWRFSYMVGSLTLLAAIVAAVWIWIVQSFVQKRRIRQFYEPVLPPLEKFMEERTPFLQRHYSQAEIAQVRDSTERASP